MSQFWENLWTDGSIDGRTDGRTDRRTDTLYFTRPFRPRPEVQKTFFHTLLLLLLKIAESLHCILKQIIWNLPQKHDNTLNSILPRGGPLSSLGGPLPSSILILGSLWSTMPGGGIFRPSLGGPLGSAGILSIGGRSRGSKDGGGPSRNRSSTEGGGPPLKSIIK